MYSGRWEILTLFENEDVTKAFSKICTYIFSVQFQFYNIKENRWLKMNIIIHQPNLFLFNVGVYKFVSSFIHAQYTCWTSHRQLHVHTYFYWNNETKKTCLQQDGDACFWDSLSIVQLFWPKFIEFWGQKKINKH
jgi:hypothetical protein